MKITDPVKDGVLVVERDGGPRISVYRGFGGRQVVDPSSTFWKHVQRKLAALGYDFVKKRMWRDGHLMSDEQIYLRERKETNGRQLALWDGEYALRNAVDDYNAGHRVRLVVDNLGSGIVQAEAPLNARNVRHAMPGSIGI